MLKTKGLFQFLGLIVVTIVTISQCTSPDSKIMLQKQFNHCTHADSMIEYFQNNESDINPQFLSIAAQILKRNQKPLEAKKIDSFYTNYVKTTQNKKVKFYYEIDHAYADLTLQNFENTDSHISNLSTLKNEIKDSTIDMVFHTYLGTYLFVNNKLDSANKILLKAYYTAIALKDDMYTERLCNNLGSLALRIKQYRNARYFLSKAIQIMNNRKDSNPVLISNLATAYMSEGNLEQAKNTLLNGMDKSIPKESYAYQLMRLNLAMVFQTMENFGESKKIINELNKDSIKLQLRAPYLILQLAQTIPNGKDELQKFISDHKIELLKNQESLLEFYKNGLEKIIQRYPELLTEFGFSESTFRSLSYENWKYEQHEILATLAKNKGQHQIALNEKALSNEALLELASKQKLSMSSEIDMAIQNIELENSNAVLESENKFKSKQITLTNIILILAVILLGIIIYFWRKNNRVQQRQIVIAEELLQSKLESERLLSNENRLNEKLMALSKLIVEKSIIFAEKLKTSDVAKNPKIVEVRRGLEKLAELDEAFEQTRSEFGNESIYKPIWEKYPDLNELSSNAKKVLLLSIQSYRPKEIASMLDLSYDYVRNLKTKLNQIFAKNNISGYEALNELIQNKSEA